MSDQGGVGGSTDVPDEGGLVLPKDAKTGRTIAGLVYKDGVILGVRSRATVGITGVADMDRLSIHDISPNILCYREDSRGDTNPTANMIASNITLSKISFPQLVAGNLLTVKRVLNERLFQYQGYISKSPSDFKVHGTAALVTGRVDDSGPHLYVYDPHGCKKAYDLVSIGPDSLKTMETLRRGQKQNMNKHEAMILVRDAIAGGKFEDPDSGPAVDLFIIKTGNAMEYRLPYCHSNREKYQDILTQLKSELLEGENVEVDGTFREFVKDVNELPIRIINPLCFSWQEYLKYYINKVPDQITFLFVGMNPSTKTPFGIPFCDKHEFWKFWNIDRTEELKKKISRVLPRDVDDCVSGRRFWKFVAQVLPYENGVAYKKHCFVMNCSPLIFAGANAGKDRYKNVSLKDFEKLGTDDDLVGKLKKKTNYSLKDAIIKLKPKRIVAIGEYARDRLRDLGFHAPERVVCVPHPSPRGGQNNTTDPDIGDSNWFGVVRQALEEDHKWNELVQEIRDINLMNIYTI